MKDIISYRSAKIWPMKSSLIPEEVLDIFTQSRPHSSYVTSSQEFARAVDYIKARKSAEFRVGAVVKFRRPWLIPDLVNRNFKQCCESCAGWRPRWLLAPGPDQNQNPDQNPDLDPGSADAVAQYCAKRQDNGAILCRNRLAKGTGGAVLRHRDDSVIAGVQTPRPRCLGHQRRPGQETRRCAT